VTAACTHRLCELIGGDCSLAITRSRGCRPGAWTSSVAPAVFEEVRALLAVIEPDAPTSCTEASRAAAARLAQIIRGEALEQRNLLAHARDDEPELAELLAPLLARSDARADARADAI
jgi:hypothetical protein